MGASRLIKSSWRHAPRDQSWPSVGKTLARATMGQKRAGFNADAPSGSRGAQCRRDVTRTGPDRNSETRTTLGVENERAPRTCASCNASRADLRGFIIISPTTPGYCRYPSEARTTRSHHTKAMELGCGGVLRGVDRDRPVSRVCVTLGWGFHRTRSSRCDLSTHSLDRASQAKYAQI